MQMKTDYLSDKWLKAAVIGGLWASIEIVVGSFLHNLRIPFAGTILASQGILILIAFSQIWRENGIIIRAGIITALMKSISPSSVILGPMIGIFVEALLLEFFLLLFRRGIVGVILGSAAALSSALLHKIFSIIILYGWNIVLIYKNIFAYFQKFLNIDLLSPLQFVLLILFIYIAFGAFAGILGLYIGKRAKILLPTSKAIDADLKTEDLFPLNTNQQFNLFLLALNVVLIPVGIVLINLNVLYYGLPFLLLYTLFAYWRYTTILRRLKKPIFWIQLLVIIAMSGFFLTNQQSNQIFSIEGFNYGLEMSFRALFIVLVFTAISIELRNPRIKQLLYAHHLGSLHASLSLAFSALPIIIKSLPPVKLLFKQPIDVFANLIASNVQWYTLFNNRN